MKTLTVLPAPGARLGPRLGRVRRVLVVAVGDARIVAVVVGLAERLWRKVGWQRARGRCPSCATCASCARSGGWWGGRSRRWRARFKEQLHADAAGEGGAAYRLNKAASRDASVVYPR